VAGKRRCRPTWARCREVRASSIRRPVVSHSRGDGAGPQCGRSRPATARRRTAKAVAWAEAVYGIVLDMGGTIRAQHDRPGAKHPWWPGCSERLPGVARVEAVSTLRHISIRARFRFIGPSQGFAPTGHCGTERVLGHRWTRGWCADVGHGRATRAHDPGQTPDALPRRQRARAATKTAQAARPS